jgi:hypothetical protein
MVLGFGRKKTGRGNSVPWDFVDSREGATTTTWDEEPEGQWFLESPPGNWEMEKPSESGEGEDADDDNRKVPFESLPEEVEEEEAYPPREAAETGAWTISVLCLGLGLIAACLIIPQADENRRMVYEREQLRLELAHVQKQTALNQEFLDKMETDPQLTERLAQREMHVVEKGEAVVKTEPETAGLPSVQNSARSKSPFTLVNVPPAARLAPYQPVGGVFATLCRNPQSHVYILGFGMFCVAAGLVLGGPAKPNGTTDNAA